MTKSLSELWANAREVELHAKIAAVQESYGDSEVYMDLLDQTVDMLKEAEESGDLVDLDVCDTFTLAVNIVDDFLKEAAKDDDDDEDEDDKKPAFLKGKKKERDKEAADDEDEDLDKQAAYYHEAVGAVAHDILAEHGVSLDDLEKVAEEEVEELGRWLAREAVARLEATEA